MLAGFLVCILCPSTLTAFWCSCVYEIIKMVMHNSIPHSPNMHKVPLIVKWVNNYIVTYHICYSGLLLFFFRWSWILEFRFFSSASSARCIFILISFPKKKEKKMHEQCSFRHTRFNNSMLWAVRSINYAFPFTHTKKKWKQQCT